jgi:protein O-mannosyl-transferase
MASNNRNSKGKWVPGSQPPPARKGTPTPQRPQQARPPQGRPQPVRPQSARPAPVKKAVAAPLQTDALSARKKLFIDLALAATAVLATFVFYHACLDDKFTNWDDPGYLNNNEFLRDVTAAGIQRMFRFDSYLMGNYHPLTALSYAIEYSYNRLNPFLYHLDNLLFHMLNTLLVYWLAKVMSGRSVVAVICALLFGLHPMHVESVAWIPGRKDVLFTGFYVLASISYFYYIRTDQKARKWLLYSVVMLFYITALLSKAVSVTFAVVMFLYDFIDKRKIDYKGVLEKVPFIILAIFFGIISFQAQKSFGALGTQNVHYSAIDRIALAGYAYDTYLWKSLIPVGLCCFYPYPDVLHGGLAWYYYLYPVSIVGALTLAGWWAHKNRVTEKFPWVGWPFLQKYRVVIFGFMFFTLNILLLLQFIPVGGAIIADRYAYLSYFGLFYMAGWFISKLFLPGANRQLGYVAMGASLFFCVIMGFLSYQRCLVWYDAFSMWRDEIEKHPNDSPNAYNNLGFEYYNKFNDTNNPAEKKVYYDSAFYLLNRAIQIIPIFVNPYVSLGELERSTQQFDEAKKNYRKALSLDPKEANAYLGLGILFSITHDLDSSGYNYRMAMKLKPNWAEAYGDYANYLDMAKKFDSAIYYYTLAIKLNPEIFGPYLNRARAYQRNGRCDMAMKDFQTAIDLKPENGDIYYARSWCYNGKMRFDSALIDMDKALSLGFKDYDKGYYEHLKESVKGKH